MKDRRRRTMGTAGLDLLKSCEGCRLKPYLDSAGKLTIGWGHLVRKGESFPVDGITVERAEALLKADLSTAEDAVNGGAGVPLSQNEFDALTSLTFNIGATAFLESSVLRRVNEDDLTRAANAFSLWNKVRDPVTGKLVVSFGLSLRRAKERLLFLSPDATEGGTPTEGVF